ncbi:MAG TPA: hypothetical protein VIE43_01670 [Thermoanaerobaculia bacterium]|jgi:hypothetical protein|nr:hypothetical protein [Thermoanaerobaculia bacterium]
MDDSERTYGYSDDIYHGSHDRKDEKSYEYGPENAEEVEGEALSPEESAMHIEGARAGEVEASGEAGTYDYSRGDLGSTESFTWADEGSKGKDQGKTQGKREPSLSEQRLEPAKREP